MNPSTEDATILAKASLPMRAVLLDTARDLTCGDRNVTYGEPVGNMQDIADIFNAISGRDLSATEVALFNCAIKLARLTTSPRHQDSYVDLMAYAGIAYECALDEENPNA